LIPEDLEVKILQGYLKGQRWIVGSGPHSQWVGTYELPKQIAFAAAIKPGSVILDVGSHVGFFTLLASVLAGETGRVVALEPNPRNLSYLKRHVQMNDLKNVTIIEAAASDRRGAAWFDFGVNSTAGSIAQSGEIVVRTVRLDDLYESGIIPRIDILKMDIEGAELSALLASQELVRDSRPIIFLETHGAKQHEGCLELLGSWGYTIQLLATAFPDEEQQELVARPMPSETPQ
jgi:FkbM family methyltransferase